MNLDVDRLTKPVSLTFTYGRQYHLTQRQRPQIMVSFRRHDPDSGALLGAARANLIVDSGSDFTLIPDRYAEQLGYRDIAELPRREIHGISGKMFCYGHIDLDALLCDKWVNVPICFYKSQEKVGLLGRSGAFDALQLAFLNREKLLYAGQAQ